MNELFERIIYRQLSFLKNFLGFIEIEKDIFLPVFKRKNQKIIITPQKYQWQTQKFCDKDRICGAEFCGTVINNNPKYIYYVMPNGDYIDRT